MNRNGHRQHSPKEAGIAPLLVLAVVFFRLPFVSPDAHQTSRDKARVDREYYPADSANTISDTVASSCHIHTEVFPLRDSLVSTYREYVDTLKQKISRDRIHYRDYGLRIRIRDLERHAEESYLISKFEFISILKSNPRYYFIREARFVDVVNSEFRFDIMLSYLDSAQPDVMIKYFISKNGKCRFENYPPEFYEKMFPPD
jgi:hypothetical protein